MGGRLHRGAPGRPAVTAVGLASALLLALGGCGAQDDRLSAGVAHELAGRADRVAALLAARDACRARRAAAALRTHARSAVEAGSVPESLAGELLARARRLAGSIACVPEPAPTPTAEVDDDAGDGGEGKGEGEANGTGQGKGKAKGKGQGKGKGRD